MRLLLIGPPGSGKGTQATVVADHFGIAHISSGALLRQHVADGTPTGRVAAEFVTRGDLVPDRVVIDVLRNPVEAASRSGGYVLDGFPRTIAQAEAADPVFRELGAWLEVALCLAVPENVLLERMRRRAEAEGRVDDTESVMLHRIAEFEEQTPPLLDYCARHVVLLRVDGARPVDEVSATIITELERVRSAHS